MTISKITIIQTNQEFLVACDPLKIKSFILGNVWSHFYFDKDKINLGDNLNKLLHFSPGKTAISFLSQNYRVEVFEQPLTITSISDPDIEILQIDSENNLENSFGKPESDAENTNEILRQDLEDEVFEPNSDLENQNPENSSKNLESDLPDQNPVSNSNKTQKRFSKNHKKNR